MIRSRCRRFRSRRAATLVEIMVSAMLVGLMMVAALRAVGAVFCTRLVAYERQHGEALAHELMAEILQSCYEEPDLPAGSFGLEGAETGDGSRAPWDDVDDYDNWSASPPQAKDGAPLPDAAGWTREVDVDRVVRVTPELPWFMDTGLKRIEVVVTSPTGEEFRLKALRSRWGALEMKSPVDATYVTGVSAELQVGPQSSPALDGAAVVNHAQGP